MSDSHLLFDLFVISVVAVIVVVILRKLKLPTTVGLILAGIFLGPNAFSLVREQRSIELLAEIGVGILLFTVGLEFSLKRLRLILRSIIIGGTVQVLLTTSVIFTILLMMGYPAGSALFVGVVVSFSSTAIVLKVMSDRGELEAPQGRFVVGVLIFQDLFVVFVMLLLPVLSNRFGSTSSFGELCLAVLKGLGVVSLSLVFAKTVVPKMFSIFVKGGSRELFLLAVGSVFTGTVWITHQSGLSVALGCFLAGLILADTEFKHRAIGDLMPFRDLFTSLFFFSLGMMFDISTLIEKPFDVLIFIIILVVIKGMIATFSAQILLFPARIALICGVSLAQFSEFGFVALKMGIELGLVLPTDAKYVIDTGVISMVLAPILMHISPQISAGHAILKPIERLFGVRGIHEATNREPLRDHIVLVGFGVAGRILASALKRTGIRYIVLELNPETVRAESAKKEHIYYADATSPEALKTARIADALALVILINDQEAVKRIVTNARRCAPNVPIIARTRYLSDHPELVTLGASDVVVEEVEAGLEVLEIVLSQLGVSRGFIYHLIRRSRDAEVRKSADLKPMEGEIRGIRVAQYDVKENDYAVGRSLKEIDLQRRTGVLVVFILENGKTILSVNPDTPLKINQTLFLSGDSDGIEKAMLLLETGLME